jgi:hypothetical protein
LEVLVNDPGFAINTEERRRLLEANASAARFFRRQLLQTADGWAAQYLKDAQIEQVLSIDSEWKVGYAPASATGLVDHLRAERFSDSTMVRAGLATRTDDGQVADRFRDQLVLLARTAQLIPGGFIGITRDGEARPLESDAVVHQYSNVLVGIEEQIDLLRAGAVPVIVDHPVDAIAVSTMSRQTDAQWAAIPVCGPALSTAQTRMLRKFTMGDQAIVILTGDAHRQKLTSAYLTDLAFHYYRLRAVILPCRPGLLVSADGGPQLMSELLAKTPPTLSFRLGVTAADLIPDPEPPDRGPGL